MGLKIKPLLLIAFVHLYAHILLAQDTTQSPLKTTPLFNTPTNSVEIKTDSTKIIPAKGKAATRKDSAEVKLKHDPRKATFRSAVLPGWGQAYNREYWKIPIVYGALAIPASLYIYNNKWYQKTKYAYDVVINGDTANYDNIDPKLQGLIDRPQDLQYYRNEFRQNR